MANDVKAMKDMIKLCKIELKELKAKAKESAKVAAADEKAVVKKAAEVAKLEAKLNG